MVSFFVAQKNDVYSGLGEDDGNCGLSNANREERPQKSTLDEKEENTNTGQKGGRELREYTNEHTNGEQPSEESGSERKQCESVYPQDEKARSQDRCS